MKKTIIQGSISILLFLGTWFALQQIDWICIFNIQEVTDKTEKVIGDQFWEFFKKTEKENKNTHVLNSVDSIVSHICKSNKIERDKIKIHILNKDEINAFALPNGHLIVYSDLIINSDNQEELAGVICHEMAHIEQNHVMKKLVKEIGLSVLISLTTSNGGGEITRKAAKMLSSSAFDRSLEKEADLKAVDYLMKAKINPEPFANFLYKLSNHEHEASKYLSWISTHPDSKERAEYIVDRIKGTINDYQSMISTKSWDQLKEELKV